MTHQELQTLAGPDIVQPRPGLYKVSRASSLYGKPCDEAYPARVTASVAEWIAEIPDILAFVDKYGPCVVRRNGDGWATVEIYDDYIE